MRIAFCLGEMNKGGAERVVCNLANYLVSLNNEVIVIVTKLDKMEYEFDKKVKFYVLDEKNISTNLIIRNIRRIHMLKKILFENNVDICLAFLQEPIARALVLKLISLKMKSIPLIISVRIDPKKAFKGIKRRLSLFLYNLADGFVFQTAEAQSFFNKRINKRSVIIGNPINPDFFNCDVKIKRDKTIIAVGRLTIQKNYPMLLKAFNIVNRKYPNYVLKIFGAGELKEQLSDIIKANNLQNNVFLMGNSNNIQQEMASSKIYVISSDYEGMSNSLMEAMTLGLPCISTKSSGGGAESLIINEENGLLVPVGDFEALANSIMKLISNEELYKKISLNSKMSMDKYHPDIINDKWINYMKKIFSEKNN